MKQSANLIARSPPLYNQLRLISDKSTNTMYKHIEKIKSLNCKLSYNRQSFKLVHSVSPKSKADLTLVVFIYSLFEAKQVGLI